MENNHRKRIKRILITILLVALFAVSSFLTACSKPQEAVEGGVNAADPMTPEEQAADDSGGCIEDSEDLLN